MIDKFEVTVTPEHLDTAIKIKHTAKAKGEVYHSSCSCVMAEACKQQVENFSSSSFDYIALDNKEERGPRYLEYSCDQPIVMTTITESFDDESYSKVRKLLPITFVFTKNQEYIDLWNED